jgi:DNA-binding MarR family transcriptional regulator
MAQTGKNVKTESIRAQSRRLRDAMVWLVRGFTLYDPRKAYPDFYLSPQQSYVLSVVHDHGPITPGEVAKRLRLEKSHLTKIVNSLITMGAIAKEADTGDRRRLMLKLSAKGIEIFRDLDKASVDSYVKLMANVPPEDRKMVIRAVEVMLKAMEEIRKEK